MGNEIKTHQKRSTVPEVAVLHRAFTSRFPTTPHHHDTQSAPVTLWPRRRIERRDSNSLNWCPNGVGFWRSARPCPGVAEVSQLGVTGLWEQCPLFTKCFGRPFKFVLYLMVWCGARPILYISLLRLLACAAMMCLPWVKPLKRPSHRATYCATTFGCAARHQGIGSECCFYIWQASGKLFEVRPSPLQYILIWECLRIR